MQNTSLKFELLQDVSSTAGTFMYVYQINVTLKIWSFSHLHPCVRPRYAILNYKNDEWDMWCVEIKTGKMEVWVAGHMNDPGEQLYQGCSSTLDCFWAWCLGWQLTRSLIDKIKAHQHFLFEALSLSLQWKDRAVLYYHWGRYALLLLHETWIQVQQLS